MRNGPLAASCGSRALRACARTSHRYRWSGSGRHEGGHSRQLATHGLQCERPSRAPAALHHATGDELRRGLHPATELGPSGSGGSAGDPDRTVHMRMGEWVPSAAEVGCLLNNIELALIAGAFPANGRGHVPDPHTRTSASETFVVRKPLRCSDSRTTARLSSSDCPKRLCARWWEIRSLTPHRKAPNSRCCISLLGS